MSYENNSLSQDTISEQMLDAEHHSVASDSDWTNHDNNHSSGKKAKQLVPPKKKVQISVSMFMVDLSFQERRVNNVLQVRWERVLMALSC